MKRAMTQWILAAIFVAIALATNVRAAEDIALYQANGIKIGEVTQTTAIIWTRLTAEPEMLKGIPFAAKGAMNPDAPKNSPASQLPPGKKLSDMEGYVGGAAGEVRVTYRVDSARALPKLILEVRYSRQSVNARSASPSQRMQWVNRAGTRRT